MDQINDVKIVSLERSRFLEPKRVSFTQNGVKRNAECVSEHDDVSVLIFNTSRDVFIFVKQFRPVVYLCSSETTFTNNVETIDTEKHPGSLGFTIELCSGIVDKEKPLIEIAQEEIREECGYSVPLEHLRRITSFRNGSYSRLTGSLDTLFYAEVTDAMKTGTGGGLAEEGELIEVVEIPRSQAQDLIWNEHINREAVLLVALQWFFETFEKK